MKYIILFLLLSNTLSAQFNAQVGRNCVKAVNHDYVKEQVLVYQYDLVNSTDTIRIQEGISTYSTIFPISNDEVFDYRLMRTSKILIGLLWIPIAEATIRISDYGLVNKRWNI